MTVTQEEVIWCYSALLGRKPESADAVNSQIASAKDFRALVLNFIGSQEYRTNHSTPVLLPLDATKMELDLVASPADLASLIERVRASWVHLGSVRPHYSVLSAVDYLPQSINDASIAAFYASAAAEIASIKSILKRYGHLHLESKVCVEYGCGLGRATLPLAKVFAKVHAYDISANHIAMAEKRTKDTGITNIKYHLCVADRMSENLESCDFFYSRIVFQHNPPPIIRVLIAASLKSLRPGGIAIFQVPTFGAGYSFRIKEYLAKPPRLDMEMHCIPQSEVFSLVASANCKILEVREDGSIGLHGKWISNTFFIQRPVHQ